MIKKQVGIKLININELTSIIFPLGRFVYVSIAKLVLNVIKDFQGKKLKFEAKNVNIAVAKTSVFNEKI